MTSGATRSRLVVAALIGLALLVAIVAGAAAAPEAGATFPGKNGRIAFNSEGAIFLVNANGSGLTRLATTNSEDTTTGISFSRDGRRLAFSAFKGTDPDIYVIGTDGRGLRQVTFSRGIDVDPTWSPAGRIAFETNRNGNVDIYSVDDRGRSPLRLTSAAQDELDPAWSPRGDRIAYTVEAGSSRQIWVMNADGSAKRQLTNDPTSTRTRAGPGRQPHRVRLGPSRARQPGDLFDEGRRNGRDPADQPSCARRASELLA